MRAVDCQSFAGGFTVGMVQAGFELVGKREEVPFGVPNCENNRHVLGDNWETFVGDPLTWPTVPAQVVFGNPPCSGFSLASVQSFRGVDSKVNACMWNLVRFAARTPGLEAVAFESVQPAYKQGRELMLRLRKELEDITGKTWHLTHLLHDAHALGGPAIRRRYFFVCTREPLWAEHMPAVVPKPDRNVLGAAIGDLVDWPVGQWEATTAAAPDGHICPDASIVRMIEELFTDWAPGEALSQVLKRRYEAGQSIPERWAKMSDKLVANDWQVGYFQPRRWNMDKPGRVIAGSGPQVIIHPTENRCFTYREAARVMGFPDAWKIAPLQDQPRGQRDPIWGKGITSQCGLFLGRWLQLQLDYAGSEAAGTEVGEREREVSIK